MEHYLTRERRRLPRERVTWLVRVLLTDTFSISGCAVNASVHGLWLDLPSVPTRFLHLGATYRLQVRPGTRSEFECWAVLRRLDPRGAALETRSLLPVAPAGSVVHSQPGDGAVCAGGRQGARRRDDSATGCASRASTPEVVAEPPRVADCEATCSQGHGDELVAEGLEIAEAGPGRVTVQAERTQDEKLAGALEILAVNAPLLLTGSRIRCATS